MNTGHMLEQKYDHVPRQVVGVTHLQLQSHAIHSGMT